MTNIVNLYVRWVLLQIEINWYLVRYVAIIYWILFICSSWLDYYGDIIGDFGLYFINIFVCIYFVNILKW